VSAELIADRWGLTRGDLDEFAARSHRLASEAAARGSFASQVLPVGEVTEDETIRSWTTVETLERLRPAFDSSEYRMRFPDIDWKITAGNSSPLTDSASAALIMAEETASRLGLEPRGRFHSFAVVGDDPLLMLTGPIPATRRILDRSGLTMEDLDAYEVNEAFASVPLAWAADLHADPEKLNPWGGAIALGHALGSSGTRLVGTLLAYLEETGGRYGLVTMCEGGGMANATIIERL
jgi:acetyl-CoA acyltransferase